MKTCSQPLTVIYFIKHRTATSYFLLLMCTVSGNRKKHMAHIQIKAHHTCMILESSSKEFLQSPQYSWANWSMYLFTLAEVELIPPLLPDSSWKRGENKRNHVWSTKLTAAEQHLRQGSLAVLGSIKGQCPASLSPARAGSMQHSFVSCYLWLFRSCLIDFTQKVFQLRSVSH